MSPGAARPAAAPIIVGLLFDFPQGDGGAGFEAAARLGLDDVAATGRLDRPVEMVSREIRGLPMGTEREMVDGFRAMEAEGALLVLGPSISDNGLIVRDLADAAGLACINYTGGEHTRSRFMFQYQIGSLEEEPAILARRLAQRGLTRAAVVHDRSPVGNRYAECFEDARAGLGIDVTGTAALSPVAEDARDAVTRLRAGEPDALVYLGLGLSSRAVAIALAELAWNVPVVANSALMFGYVRPEWRDAWAGWEYLDGVADDNRNRQRLAERSRAAAGPVGCAAYDMGRLAGEAIARARHLTRAGVRDALEQVKALPATSGVEGTTMGFGVYDHGALKGGFLVLREWRDGETVQVAT